MRTALSRPSRKVHCEAERRSRRSRKLLYCVVLAALIAGFSTGCTRPTNQSGQAPTSRAEAIARVLACIRGAGWDVTTSDDGGIDWDGTNEQAKAFDRDRDRCLRSVQPDTQRSLSEPEIKLAYAKQKRTLACLRKLGFSLPDAPTFQNYRDANAAWSPYNQLPQSAFAQGTAPLEKKCPQARLED